MGMTSMSRFPQPMVITKPCGRTRRVADIVGNDDIAPLYGKQRFEGGALELVHDAREKLDAPGALPRSFEAILTPADSKLPARRFVVMALNQSAAVKAVDEIQAAYFSDMPMKRKIVRPCFVAFGDA